MNSSMNASLRPPMSSLAVRFVPIIVAILVVQDCFGQHHHHHSAAVHPAARPAPVFNFAPAQQSTFRPAAPIFNSPRINPAAFQRSEAAPVRTAAPIQTPQQRVVKSVPSQSIVSSTRPKHQFQTPTPVQHPVVTTQTSSRHNSQFKSFTQKSSNSLKNQSANSQIQGRPKSSTSPQKSLPVKTQSIASAQLLNKAVQNKGLSPRQKKVAPLTSSSAIKPVNKLAQHPAKNHPLNSVSLQQKAAPKGQAVTSIRPKGTSNRPVDLVKKPTPVKSQSNAAGHNNVTLSTVSQKQPPRKGNAEKTSKTTQTTTQATKAQAEHPQQKQIALKKPIRTGNSLDQWAKKIKVPSGATKQDGDLILVNMGDVTAKNRIDSRNVYAKATQEYQQALATGSTEDRAKAYIKMQKADLVRIEADGQYVEHQKHVLNTQLTSLDKQVNNAQTQMYNNYRKPTQTIDPLPTEGIVNRFVSKDSMFGSYRPEDVARLKTLTQQRDKLLKKASRYDSELRIDGQNTVKAQVESGSSQVGLQAYQAALDSGYTQQQATAYARQERDNARFILQVQTGFPPTLLSSHNSTGIMSNNSSGKINGGRDEPTGKINGGRDNPSAIPIGTVLASNRQRQAILKPTGMSGRPQQTVLASTIKGSSGAILNKSYAGNKSTRIKKGSRLEGESGQYADPTIHNAFEQNPSTIGGGSPGNQEVNNDDIHFDQVGQNQPPVNTTAVSPGNNSGGGGSSGNPGGASSGGGNPGFPVPSGGSGGSKPVAIVSSSATMNKLDATSKQVNKQANNSANKSNQYLAGYKPHPPKLVGPIATTTVASTNISLPQGQQATLGNNPYVNNLNGNAPYGYSAQGYPGSYSPSQSLANPIASPGVPLGYPPMNSNTQSSNPGLSSETPAYWEGGAGQGVYDMTARLVRL